MVRPKQYKRALLLAALLLLGAAASPAAAHPVSWEVFYTRFAGSPNLKRTEIRFDGESVTVGPLSAVADVEGADGLVFASDGDLLIGGQGDRVHKVPTEGGGEHVTVNAAGLKAFHLTLDPSGQSAWTSGMPGHLVEIPLQPFADGFARPVHGDDRTITSIAFASNGMVFYTAGDHRGDGNFGVLDLKTFSTIRLMTGLPAAHAITFDPFTGDLFLFGANQIVQIDPRDPREIKSSLVFDQDSLFDQGTADGDGHIVVARTSGHIVFIDYKVSGLVGDDANFVAAAFVDSNLDDIAPLAGLGANPATAALSAPDAADEGSGEAEDERPEADAGPDPDSVIPAALTALGLALLLALILVIAARILRAPGRRVRQTEKFGASSRAPKGPADARQRDAELLDAAQRGFAGFLSGAEPKGLLNALVRDAVTFTGSTTGTIYAELRAAQGRDPVKIKVDADLGVVEPGDAAGTGTTDIPLKSNGKVLGRLTLSQDASAGKKPSGAALAPLAAAMSAILSRIEPAGDDSQVLQSAARALQEQIPLLTAHHPDLDLSKLKAMQATLAKLSSIRFDDVGDEKVDLSAIAEEVAAALRDRDPGRTTEISIAPGAKAVGHPERLRAAIEGLLGAAWWANGAAQPSHIEFGVTDRGGQAVCFARRDGSAPLSGPIGEDEGSPAPDLGLSLVRHALGGSGARVWTEKLDNAEQALLFALPGRSRVKSTRSGWQVPASGKR